MSKVWFVTGASRGLGREIAEAALGAGDQVVATARRPSELQDMRIRWDSQVRTLPLDVTDVAAVGAAIGAAHQAFGRLDVVVNNAGQADLASIEDSTEEAFRNCVHGRRSCDKSCHSSPT